MKTIPKNHIKKKRPNMSLLVGQCLQKVHLMKKKIDLIIVEENLYKMLKKRGQENLEVLLLASAT